MTAKLSQANSAKTHKRASARKLVKTVSREAQSGKFVTSEGKKFAATAGKYAKDRSKTPDEAIATLKRIGILTPSGKLSKRYK